MRTLAWVLAFALAFPAHGGAQSKNVVILHSYQHDYAWTRLQHDGIMSALGEAEGGSLSIKTDYLDAKRSWVERNQSLGFQLVRALAGQARVAVSMPAVDVGVRFDIRLPGAGDASAPDALGYPAPARVSSAP